MSAENSITKAMLQKTIGLLTFHKGLTSLWIVAIQKASAEDYRIQKDPGL
jgi:hypothetical protein